jgi:hypothetical protein
VLQVYGNMKYHNKDEYYGKFGNQFGNQYQRIIIRQGEGVFIEASTGRVERRLYENDVVKKVLEVIEEGHQRS